MPCQILRSALSVVNPIMEPLARSVVTGPLPIGLGLTMVETVGRRSGAPRSRPLLAVRLADLVVAGTIRRRSDWVANVRADDNVSVWLDGKRVDAEASVIPLPLGSLAAFTVAD